MRLTKSRFDLEIGITLIFFAGFRAFASMLGITTIWWAVYTVLGSYPTIVGMYLMLFGGLAEVLISLGLGRYFIKQAIKQEKEASGK